MKLRLIEFFKDSYKKLILVALLCLTAFVFDQMEFPKVDALIRDSLQYLNSTDKIDKSLVTVNIDTFSKETKKPFSFNYIKRVIDTLESYEPKSIVLLIEPTELEQVDADKFSKYFESKHNLFIDLQTNESSFYKNKNFKEFNRYIFFPLGTDTSFGAKDNKPRRAMLSSDTSGQDKIFSDLREIGIFPKDPTHYQYPIHFWGTTQALMKNFPPETFGFFRTKDFLEKKEFTRFFKNKIVLIGSFDEWSFLAPASVFDLFGSIYQPKFEKNNFPYQSAIANLINLYSSGDYIKYLHSRIFLLLTLLLVVIGVLLIENTALSIASFILLSPALLLINVLAYKFFDFYLDFSTSISFLIFLQYLALPFYMLYLFKKQETEKLEEITKIRISSLLTIAERIAHDIRSPLSSIKISMKKEISQGSTSYSIITSSIKQIENISSDLIQDHTILDEPTDLKETINLNRALSSVVQERQTSHPHVKFQISINCSEPIITGTESMVKSIISNILNNSIDSLNKTSPSIDIVVTESHKYYLVKIQDNGSGIPPHILSLIGKKRISSKPKKSGSGIGLLHTQNVLTTLRGRMEIASSNSNGTVVLLYFSKPI